MGQTRIKRFEIAPADVVRFTGECLDSMAAENFIALRVKSV